MQFAATCLVTTAPPAFPSLATMWRLSRAKIPASAAKRVAATRLDDGSLAKKNFVEFF